MSSSRDFQKWTSIRGATVVLLLHNKKVRISGVGGVFVWSFHVLLMSVLVLS